MDRGGPVGRVLILEVDGTDGRRSRRQPAASSRARGCVAVCPLVGPGPAFSSSPMILGVTRAGTRRENAFWIWR
ncbi:MAG: hypothetical protein GY859_11990 [Desulfobacterales bacterium]|nr:hypothetical protein [Desulfobacterales bacterium]